LPYALQAKTGINRQVLTSTSKLSDASVNSRNSCAHRSLLIPIQRIQISLKNNQQDEFNGIILKYIVLGLGVTEAINYCDSWWTYLTTLIYSLRSVDWYLYWLKVRQRQCIMTFWASSFILFIVIMNLLSCQMMEKALWRTNIHVLSLKVL
jgi:hypothetical protein